MNWNPRMKSSDKRKHKRVKTINLISYVSIGKDGGWISHCMGRALNVSQSGILVETLSPLKSEFVSLMTTDINNNLIEIKGSLIYCREISSKIYQAGISFIGTADDITKFVVQLNKVYHYKQNNVFLSVG